MGATVPGVGIFEVICEVGGEFSVFSCFWANLSIFDRVSRAVVVVGGASEFEMIADVIGNEKTAIFCGIWLVVGPVVLNFVFFPFPESTRDCDMSTQVG